jgi:maltose/moltooligosaccharide transporter
LTSSSWYYSDSVKYSFYFGGIAFIVTVLWTVITSKEYSPEVSRFEKHKETSLIKETHSADWFASNGKSHLMKGILFLIVSALFSFVFNFDLKKDLYVLSLGLIGLGGLAMLISGLMQKNNTDNGFVTIMNDFQFMPKS